MLEKVWKSNGNVFELLLVSENQHPRILSGEYDDEEPVIRSRCVLGYFISLMLIEFLAFSLLLSEKLQQKTNPRRTGRTV